MTDSDHLANSAALAANSDRGERADILESLRTQRHFLRHTVDGLSDDQARQRPTVSELTLGGLIKHVTATESTWVDFIERGASAMPAVEGDWSNLDPEVAAQWAAEFQMLAEESLGGLLERYAEVAARTDALVESLPDLDLRHDLPAAPWFPPGASRSARRVFQHIVAETAQHSGHADIIRESIDGQKSMG